MWKSLNLATIQNSLPDKAAKRLSKFLSASDGSLAHPRDAERFYSFIIHCHRYRVGLTALEFKALLTNSGLSADYSEHLAGIYYRGRELLKVNMQMR